MKRLAVISFLLTCAACRHRQRVLNQPVVTAPPPPTQTSAPQAPAPRVNPRPAPAASAPPPPVPVQRPQQGLQSTTDAVGDRPAIEARLRQVRSQLEALGRRSLSSAAAQDRTRAGSMLDLAQQALSRGNLRQAEELSTRAAMLARTLTDAR